jgi:hypothetical protein
MKNLADTFKSSPTSVQKIVIIKSNFPFKQTIDIGLHIKLFQYTNKVVQIWWEDLMDTVSFDW